MTVYTRLFAFLIPIRDLCSYTEIPRDMRLSHSDHNLALYAAGVAPSSQAAALSLNPSNIAHRTSLSNVSLLASRTPYTPVPTMARPTPSATDVGISHAAQDGRGLRTNPIATSIVSEECHSGSSSRSGQSGLLLFLDTHLQRGRLDGNSYDMLRTVLQMFSEISLLLFPHSHVLEARVMRRIEALSRNIIDTLHSFGEHIDAQLGRARRAMAELPELAVSHEKTRQRNLKIWRRRLRWVFVPYWYTMPKHWLTICTEHYMSLVATTSTCIATS